MAKINKVVLPAGQWVDVNSATGIAVGTAMTIQNTSSHWIKITESADEPTDDTFSKILTSLTYPSPEAKVLTGAEKVWAKSTIYNKSAVIAVQEM